MRPPLADGCILLIEDDDSNALTTSALLEDAGFLVDIASSLAEARQRLPGGQYKLVLLDNRLTDGDGLDLVPELRKHLPAAQIILVSGKNHEHRANGIDAVFIKGSDFALLLATLWRLREGWAVTR